MLISDSIASLIEQLLAEGDGTAEIGRNELAARVGCVPSQINYVITSRFTPERGYVIESRRGGGGYLRIIKKDVSADVYLMHMFATIGESIDEASAKRLVGALAERGIIDGRTQRLACAALSGAALTGCKNSEKDYVRADIFRQMLLSLMK